MYEWKNINIKSTINEVKFHNATDEEEGTALVAIWLYAVRRYAGLDAQNKKRNDGSIEGLSDNELEKRTAWDTAQRPVGVDGLF